MIIEALLALLHSEQGTPYIYGGHGPGGTDCSGLVSQLANAASGRDPFATRFDTSNEESQLAARGFVEGTAPNALVVGWNSYHTAATLPDGTPAESGGRFGGGVKTAGNGAYQAQFTHHMYLPVEQNLAPPPPPPPAPELVGFVPAPDMPDPSPPPPALPPPGDLPPPPLDAPPPPLPAPSPPDMPGS